MRTHIPSRLPARQTSNSCLGTVAVEQSARCKSQALMIENWRAGGRRDKHRPGISDADRAAGTARIGIWYYGESATTLRLIFLTMLIGSIIGL